MSTTIFISPDDLATNHTRQAYNGIESAISALKKLCGKMQTASTVSCGKNWYVFDSNQQATALSCLSALQALSERCEAACNIAEHAPHNFMEADRGFGGKLTGNVMNCFSKTNGRANLITSLLCPTVTLIPVGREYITKLYENAQISYETKGGVYKVEQYGKNVVLKYIEGGAKAVKAFGELATLNPAGIMTALSAADSIGTATSNIIYIHNEMYDEADSNSAIKTDLELLGKKITGNEDDGTTLGDGAYAVYKLAKLVDGASDMIDSIGTAKVAITGEAGYSKIWGETSFDYLEREGYSFSTKPDYFIRKALDIDPSSTVNVMYEAGREIKSTIKDSKKFGKLISELISDAVCPD